MVSMVVEVPEYFYSQIQKVMVSTGMTQDDVMHLAISRYLSQKEIEDKAIDFQVQQQIETLAA